MTKLFAIAVAVGALLGGAAYGFAAKPRVAPACCATPCAACAAGCDGCPRCAVDCAACCGSAVK